MGHSGGVFDPVGAKYGSPTDVLHFYPELSMVMGIDRTAPGLVRQDPMDEASLLFGRHFWEKRGWPTE